MTHFKKTITELNDEIARLESEKQKLVKMDRILDRKKVRAKTFTDMAQYSNYHRTHRIHNKELVYIGIVPYRNVNGILRRA